MGTVVIDVALAHSMDAYSLNASKTTFYHAFGDKKIFVVGVIVSSALTLL